MKRFSGLAALAFAGLTTAGCAPFCSPYAAGYSRYPAARPVSFVEQVMTARGRWDNVMRLPANTILTVLTFDGTESSPPTRQRSGWIFAARSFESCERMSHTSTCSSRCLKWRAQR